jgi:hypothetical protein
MPNPIGVGLTALLLSTRLFLNYELPAAEPDAGEAFEYATLRWAGRENTHVIRPSGNVEFIGTQLTKIKKPDRADDRSFYMNVALNALAREGYQLVAMTPDDYVLRRRALSGNHK